MVDSDAAVAAEPNTRKRSAEDANEDSAAAGPEAGTDAPAAKRLKEDKSAEPTADAVAGPDGGDGNAAAAELAAAATADAPGAAESAGPAAPAAAETAPAVDDETMLFGAADEDEKDEAPEDDAGPEAPETDNADGGGGEEAPAAAADTKKEEDKPVTLGYKTFAGGKECFEYFHKLLSKLTPDQDLNEYEFLVMSELIKQGHPEASRKIGDGLKAIQIREHRELATTCFFLIRNDGSVDDVSYRKCITTLFPNFSVTQHKWEGGSRFGGRGRGRGRGRGSGGGRGSQSPRGRSRGRGRGRGR